MCINFPKGFRTGKMLAPVVFLIACLTISTQTKTVCETPVVPLHGRVQVVGTIAEGYYALYSCDEGFNILGDPAHRCMFGVWSSPTPSCIGEDLKSERTPFLSSPVDTSTSPSPTSRSLDSSRSTYQPTVNPGRAISNCTCTYINLDANLAAYAGTKKLRSGDLVNDGHRIKFHCSPLGYYQLKGPSSVTCRYCRTWFSSEYPKCELPRTGDAIVRIHATDDMTEFPGGYLGVKQGSLLRLVCLSYLPPSLPGGQLDQAAYPTEHPELFEPPGNYPFRRIEMQPIWQVSAVNSIPNPKNTHVYDQVIYENGKTIKTQVLELSNISRLHNWKYVCVSSSNRNKSIEVQVKTPGVSCLRFSEDNDFTVTYDKGQSVNSSATFTCKNPHDRIIGFTSLTCMSNGDWSEDPPKCMKTCLKLQETENMRIYYSNGQATDSTANFYCSSPLIRKGVSYTRCKSDGRWADPTPTCEMSVCLLSNLYAEYPGNVLIITEQTVADVVSYNYSVRLNCGNRGLLNRLSVIAKCDIDGKWKVEFTGQQQQDDVPINRYIPQEEDFVGPPTYRPYPELYPSPPPSYTDVPQRMPSLHSYYRLCFSNLRPSTTRRYRTHTYRPMTTKQPKPGN